MPALPFDISPLRIFIILEMEVRGNDVLFAVGHDENEVRSAGSRYLPLDAEDGTPEEQYMFIEVPPVSAAEIMLSDAKSLFDLVLEKRDSLGGNPMIARIMISSSNDEEYFTDTSPLKRNLSDLEYDRLAEWAMKFRRNPKLWIDWQAAKHYVPQDVTIQVR